MIDILSADNTVRLADKLITGATKIFISYTYVATYIRTYNKHVQYLISLINSFHIHIHNYVSFHGYHI